MTWRPWVIVSLAVVALVTNGMLLFFERIPSPELAPELKKTQEKLRTLQYLPSTRRANFESMGFAPEFADATARNIGRYEKQADRYRTLLEEQGADVAKAFCPSEGLPQPYAALEFLILEENDLRAVVDPVTMRRFEAQKWYTRSSVPALYDQFERSESRKPDATLMAVSAAILRRENDALTGNSPWHIGFAGTWGFARLKKDSPRIEQLVVEYFSLMHFFTELANSPRGICS